MDWTGDTCMGKGNSYCFGGETKTEVLLEDLGIDGIG
jgi:hypothetical protein